MGLDISSLNIGVLNGGADQTRRAVAKSDIVPAVITRDEKRKAKQKNGDTLRAAVWKRDGGRCRATGVQLSRSGTDPHTVGEVDHSIPRSLAPELIYEPSNALLLSKYLNRLQKVACPEAPEYRMFAYVPVTAGDDDRSKPQRFTWRDTSGRITKERVG